MNYRKIKLIAVLVLLSPSGWAETKPTVTRKPVSKATAARSSSYVVRPSSQTVKRREAVLAMGQGADVSKAGQQLMAALSDKDAMSRALAARELGTLKYGPALESLSGLLKTDTSAEVREAAALSLKQLGNRKALPALAAAVSDPVPAVRVTALTSMGYFRDPSVRAQVEAACQDSSTDVKRTAVFVLGRLEDPQSVPVAEAMLKDTDASVRAVAAQTLGDLRAASAKPALTALLQDANKSVQISAARSLLKLGDSAGFEKAKAYALDEDLTVRLLAIDALGWSRDRQAGTMLADLLNQVPPNSRVAVQEAINRQEQLRKQK